MIRRDFLAISASTILNWRNQPFFGWIPGFHSNQSSFRFVARHLSHFGDSRVACLWKPFEEATGKPWVAHTQKGPDCVAQVAGGGMDLLTTIQIILKKKAEKWVAKSSTDMIYSGGRIIIGERKLGRNGGMHGGWAVQYLHEYGNLLRMKYDTADLTSYTKSTLNHWDRVGIPEELLMVAKEHPLLTYAPVNSWPEFRDAIAGGYPVVFCASMGGSNSKRDSQGFMTPRGTWYHSWLGAGIDDNPRRPGALLINSHSPNYGSGPKKHDQPDGSVWVDAKHIDKHCRNYNDSYALSLYQGFPKPEEEYILW